MAPGGDVDRDALLAGAFFGASWFDGRASEAMLGVLDRARVRRGAGDDVRLFGFVREGDYDPPFDWVWGVGRAVASPCATLNLAQAAALRPD